MIDDDKNAVKEIEKKLYNSNFQVYSVDSQNKAVDFIKNQPIKVCLIELDLKNDNGLKICKYLKDLDSLLKIILMADNPNHRSVVEGMRSGAFDFIEKSLEDFELISKIENSLSVQDSQISEKNSTEGHGLILVCHHSMIREGFENFCKAYSEYNLLQSIHSIDFIKTNNFNLKAELVLLCQTCNENITLSDNKFYPSLRTIFPNGKLIMINSSADDMEKKKLIKLGVRGFLPKNIFRVNMEKAFRAILKDQVWVSRKITDSLLNEYLASEKINYTPIRSPHNLSKREFEILRIISSGLTTPQISDQLFISEKTVKAHLSNIFKKLKVKSRAQAIKIAVEEHIL